jgi:glyoxylase-like metal-dependent hydrolase (beta-lactamase superfamily II)/rhodanese-related sulfurtransferase
MPSVAVERYYLGCLAHASYLISSDGVAAVIDPQRDVDLYVNEAARLGVRIEHIIETHLHADFVSGHHELAKRTGARVYLGDGSGAQFPHISVRDGDHVEFGSCRLEFLQTPGHTIESVTIVMTDLSDPARPPVAFTGDTLFVGDVGRPDLAPDHTPEQLAALLYRSLHEKVLRLPDETQVFPAHGAGSLCGKQMSADASSTIGRERRTNYALQARDADEFVRLLTESLPARPEYFARDVELNRRGAASLESLPRLEAIHPPEEAVILDVRPAVQFAAAHVAGAIHIGLGGQFASWAARLLGLDQPIVLCGDDEEHIREAQLRLARVGIDNVVGRLADTTGLEAETIPQITAAELRERLDEVTVVDVREVSEPGGIPGAIRIPLGQLSARAGEIDRSKPVVVHCKGGYRSSIACSLLRRAGVRELANLAGGFDAWESGPAGKPAAGTISRPTVPCTDDSTAGGPASDRACGANAQSAS